MAQLKSGVKIPHGTQYRLKGDSKQFLVEVSFIHHQPGCLADNSEAERGENNKFCLLLPYRIYTYSEFIYVRHRNLRLVTTFCTVYRDVITMVTKDYYHEALGSGCSLPRSRAAEVNMIANVDLPRFDSWQDITYVVTPGTGCSLPRSRAAEVHMIADVDLPCFDSWQGPPAGQFGQQANLPQAALQVGGAGADEQHLRGQLSHCLPVNVLCRVPGLLCYVSCTR